jgi:putative Mg2+ transporter-C (MgtC) family protein
MDTETIVIRLVVATVLGGIIGAEREYRDKSAGFRTLMLISLGACLYTIISIAMGNEYNSADRIASNIVTGIGFVGAGVIFKDANHVNGITTAAGIWITAAIGMAAGFGDYISAAITCGLTMIVLVFFNLIENKLDDQHKVHHYNISLAYNTGSIEALEQTFITHHLRPKRKSLQRNNKTVTGHWILHGHKKHHESLMKDLLNNEQIYELNFYQ